MLLAIHELPNPQSDLLEAGEQLANYLRAQIQSTGSIDKESAVEEMDSKGVRIRNRNLRDSKKQPSATSILEN